MVEQQDFNPGILYTALLNSVDYGIVLGNDSGRITDVNEYMLKQTGYSREDLIGNYLDTIFTNEQLLENPLQYTNIHLGLKIKNKRKIITKDGNSIPVVMSTKKISYNCLKADFYFPSQPDDDKPQNKVTEIRSLHNDLVLEIDIDSSKILTCNEAFVRSIGKTTSEIVGKKLTEIIPGPTTAVRLKYCGKAVEENRIIIFDDEYAGRSFHHIYIPLPQTGSRIIRTISMETTERLKLEQELSIQATQIELILNKVPIILYSYRFDTGGSYFSESCFRILGYTRDKLLQNPMLWHDSIHEDDVKYVDEAVNAARTKKQSIVLQYRIRDADGNWRIFLDKAEVLSNQFNSPYIIGVAVDITEQNQQDTDLKKALKQKELLMKELNHRVKNNLMIISSIISLKEEESGIDLSDIKHHIAAVRIVHEKLCQSENISDIEFKEYVTDLTENFSSSFPELKIRFFIDMKELLLPSSVVVSLGLILNELITNAIKHGFHAEKQAVVSFKLKETAGHRITIIISNNGDPIPESIDFENSASLGLRLIKALVSQIDGKLEIKRSPHPEFTLIF